MRRVLRSFRPRASDSRPARAARAVLAAAVVACAGLAMAQIGDEADPVFSATELLDASERTGPNHTVAEAVRTPGNYHVFTLTSPFGTFEAEGKSQVAVRVQELAALAALQELSRAGVFARSAGESFLKVGTGVVDVVTDPVATAKGIGSGVKRFGVNLGRRTKRAVQRVTADDDTKGSTGTSGGNVAASAAKSLIGINGAMRRWAQRVGADPYTTSPVLREALESVAQVDVAGGIAAKVAVPIPVVIGTTADVGQLVWGRDPEELRKLNETRARELGASADGASTFFRNRAFTLTMQTRLIGALHAVAVPGAGDYVATAADAADAREALFFVESAELLRQHHEAARVAAVLTDSRALVARMPAGEAVALLPLDWVRESAETTAEFLELARRATEELGATSLRLHVTGRVSARGAAALAAAGWRP